MRERAVLVAILALFLMGVAAGISVNTALGYDESVYALLARHWTQGTPASGWDLHRPPILSIVGMVPMVVVGGHEWSLRLIGAGFGVGLVVAGWWFARSVAGPLAGLIATLVLASSSRVLLESGVFLTDVPSTCLLLLLTGLLWRQLRSSEPIGRDFLWLAPVAAAAFYLRYGAVVAFLALAVAALVVGWRRLVAGRRVAGATLALFALLLVPHAIISTVSLGSPWAILRLAEGAGAGPASQDLPLLAYARWFPWELAGPFAAALAALGLLALGAMVVRRDSFALFLAIITAVDLAVMGTTVHAEPRYVLYPLALLIAVGAGAVVHGLSRFHLERRLRLSIAAAVALGLVLFGVGIGSSLQQLRDRSIFWDWKREAGLYIGQETGGGCSVLTADVPIISWYSRCPAINFAVSLGIDRSPLLTGQRRYLILRHDQHLEPPSDVIARWYLPYARLVHEYFVQGAAAAAVYRFEGDFATGTPTSLGSGPRAALAQQEAKGRP